MSQNKALSAQDVANILHVSKATIYNLIRSGDIHSYKIGRKVRFTQEDVDAYIARSRHSHSLRPIQKIDTHSTLLTPPECPPPELIISGQDVVLDILANFLQQEEIAVGRTYLSGFEGLLSLYQDNIHVAACQLFDGEAYNSSYVRSLMPGVPAVLVNIAYRPIGFYVRAGNPKGIRGWEDLQRGNIAILNRRPGSSARILLDTQLKRLGIPAHTVKGYGNIMKSHLTIAAAIAEGEADLAIGTERVAQQMDGIEFLPLLMERFDLVIKKDMMETDAVQKLLRTMNSPAFQQEVTRFSGNDYRDLGRIVAEV